MAKVRTTITIDEGLWHRFQHVAQLEERSFSSTVNAWLAQVVEPAEFVAAQISGDKHASAQRLRTLMGAVEVVNDQAAAVLAKAGARSRDAQRPGAQRTAGGVAAIYPPSCNTGGKVQATSTKPRGGKSHG